MRIKFLIILSFNLLLSYTQGEPGFGHKTREEFGFQKTEETGDFDPDEFVTEWNITAGSFTFPAGNIGTYNSEINFGDGGGWKTVTAYNDPDLTNTYVSTGTYQIRIRGTFPHIYINNNAAIDQLITKVIQWGDVGFRSFQNSFFGATNLTTLPDGPITGLNNVTVASLIFRDSGLNSIPERIFENFINCQNLNACFDGCINVPSLPDGLFKNLSALVSISQAFRSMNITTVPSDIIEGCTALTIFTATFQGTDIIVMPSIFDDCSPTNLSFTFFLCSSLTEITGVGSIDITNLTTAQSMLQGATLNTSNYNELLTGWEGQTEPSGITFHAGGSQYSAGAPATARANLISNGWSITDGGQE